MGVSTRVHGGLANLIRLLLNGRERLMASAWILMLHRRNAAMLLLISSGLSQLMKSLVLNLMKSDVKTRYLAMRSRTLWTKSVKEEDPSMRLTKSGSDLRLRNLNSKLLLRKQKVLLNRKKTKFSGLLLSSLKYAKKLSVVL